MNVEDPAGVSAGSECPEGTAQQHHIRLSHILTALEACGTTSQHSHSRRATSHSPQEQEAASNIIPQKVGWAMPPQVNLRASESTGGSQARARICHFLSQSGSGKVSQRSNKQTDAQHGKRSARRTLKPAEPSRAGRRGPELPTPLHVWCDYNHDTHKDGEGEQKNFSTLMCAFTQGTW